MPRTAAKFAVTALRSALLFFAGVAALGAQERPEDAAREAYVRAHYTKFDYRIPMRDGKKLFTSVYVPKDASKPYPILMNRTPYSVGPYGIDAYDRNLGPSEEFRRAGYIFVYQDVRGRFLSEGTFVEMNPHIDDKKSGLAVDDSTDTWDTIEFLLKNVPNNNGKVGLWGISYPGFYAAASSIDSHPALKAASPQAPMTDLFLGDDTFHGGAFMLAANFDFYTGFEQQPRPTLPPKTWVPFEFGTPDGYEFFLRAGSVGELNRKYLGNANILYNDQQNHTTYDEYWKRRDLSQHMKNIKCAVLVVGGWFDAEDLAGPFRTFHAIAKANPETPLSLVVGPWVHGGWAGSAGDQLGDVRFGSRTAEYFRAKVQFPFFEYYLKGIGAAGLPKALVFETGTNVWRNYGSWPPAEARARMLYLRAGGKLSFTPPGEGDGFDEYRSDPARPVPFLNYVATDVPERYMVDDQRFAARRTDVLVYQTEPLGEDLRVAGPVAPKLQIASTGTDSDFVVKLIDVYPDDTPDDASAEAVNNVPAALPVHLGGYQQLLRGEPMRAKFRYSWEKPEPLVPGQRTEVDFSMPDVNHTFKKGHRIMVQIQSSWFPLVDRNPQTFVEIPAAKPEDFRPATEQVFHRKDAASGILLMVLPN